MLKKFTDFTNENQISKTDIQSTECKSACKSACKSVKKIAKSQEPVIKKPKMEKVDKTEQKMEKFDFIGKIVKFSSNIKPSVSIVMLENNNVSKDKLHYIISTQTKDSLVVLKYNENADIKLTEFVNTLIDYYKKNEQLVKQFDQILIEGNDKFSIIKNIPNITLGDKKLIDILNENLVKLLK